MTPAHLYVISEGDLGPIKIGRSQNAKGRLPALQTGNPRLLKIAAIWAVSADELVEAERRLIDELSDPEFGGGSSLIFGEWFDASEKYITEYIPEFLISIGVAAERVK